MKYISSVNFLAGAMLLLAAGCSTKTDPHYTWNENSRTWRDTASGINFPDKVGALVKTGEYQFMPEAIYGRAVAYELPSRNLKICVYVYAYGLDTITDCYHINTQLPQPGKEPIPPLGNPMLTEHWKRVVEDLKKAHEDDEFTSGEEQEGGFCFANRSRLDYIRNQLAWEAKNADDDKYILEAELMVTATRNYFIKIQANYPQAERPDLLPVVNQFRQQFFEKMYGVEMGLANAVPAKAAK